MLSKTASHAKWIGFIMLMLSALLWFEQERQQPQETVRKEQILAQQAVAAASGKVAQAAPETVKSVQGRSGDEPEAAAASTSTSTVKRNYKLFPHQGQDLSKYTAVEVTATGYYAGRESTGKNPGHPEYGITYSGMKVVRDGESFSTIAADPNVFPIGTVLYVPGYGYGVVADTGSAIKGKRIDLYFETKDQVYKEWGKKTLNVFIVKKGSGKINEAVWNQLKKELLL